jgi:hypothetical protein
MGIGPLFTLDRRAGEGIGDPEGGEAFVQLSGSLAGCGRGYFLDCAKASKGYLPHC